MPQDDVHSTQTKPDLGQRIADVVIETFNKLKVKSGKPIVRSNGVREWTVLAGIVAIDQETIIPISVATGVKALPDKVRQYSQGLFVHDLHAEVLSLRLLNWWLLNEAINVSQDKDSDVVQKATTGNSRFEIKSGVKFALYVSEPPCGDASMGYISSDATPWSRSDGDESRKRVGIEPDHPTKKARLNRGRQFYGQVGVVRTKPGRNDSLVTLSKSCSDKLCLKQAIGINNCFTSELFPKILLDYLILRKDKFRQLDIDRCFGRVEGHKLKVLLYESDKYDFHKPSDGDASPSPLSLIYVVPTHTIQVLNNGVRNGSFVKNKRPKRGGESFLCNWSLATKFRQLTTITGTYLQFKQQNSRRQSEKDEVKGILGNWNHTSDDDFEVANIV